MSESGIENLAIPVGVLSGTMGLMGKLSAESSPYADFGGDIFLTISALFFGTYAIAKMPEIIGFIQGLGNQQLAHAS